MTLGADMVGDDSGEIIFLDGTLFRPKPSLASQMEMFLMTKEIQIHRVVIAQGIMGSFDWLHELCAMTGGKEFITMTSKKIHRNSNHISEVATYFANLNVRTSNIVTSGIV
jgi:hypothetical protein